MCSVVLWDVGGTLVDDAVSLEVFVHRCLTSAGIPLTALLASSIRAVDKVLRRQAQGPLWRTADDEQAADFTTDDKLLKRARRYRNKLKIPVANPLSWLQEVTI